MSTRPDPDLAASALVGREREQAALRAALARALAGHGSLVLISGEAGIGKTALAETLGAEASERGGRVLVGRCYDLSETPPYGPWTEALAYAGPATAALSPPNLTGGGAGSQATLFVQVRDFLATLASQQPLMVLLDDLHWADPASLDLLRVLARQLAALPIMVLITYRSDELTRRHPLSPLLPLLVREAHGVRIELHPLDESGLRALVGHYALPPADADRLVVYLRDRAEGNPFFAGELLRTLEEEQVLRSHEAGWTLGDLVVVGVPPLLRHVINARVDRLGEATRDLLTAAAVIGQTVPLAVWQAITATDETGLLRATEQATEARLLTETPDGAGVRFAHALIREALYDMLPGIRRRRFHRQVGEVLLATASPDPDEVAHHFQQAGDERAFAWLVRAGERAQRAYAWITAADRFEAALAIAAGQAADAGERGWLLLRLSRLRRYTEPRQGLAYLDEASLVAAETGDRVLAAYIRFSRGLLCCFVGDIQRGLTELAAACAALDALAPTDRQRMSSAAGMTPDHHRGTLALWLAESGRLAEARAQAEPIAAHTGAPVVRGLGGSGYGDACNGLGTALAAFGRPAEARHMYAQARQAYRGVDHHALAGNCAWHDLHRVVLPYQSDRVAERQRLADEAEQAWRQASGVQGDQYARFAQLPIFVLDGQWAEARTLAEMGAATEMNNGPVVVARLFLGPLARAQGDTALAWAQVRLHLPLGPATAPGNDYFQNSIILQRLAAALATDVGDLPAARAWLECHDRWLSWSGAVLGRAEGQLGWAAYYRAAGDSAQARQHAEAALAHATEPRQPLALLAAHRLLGELATAAGDYAAAQTHLSEALALADACAAPYERALCLLALADLRAATDDRDGAQETLAEARAILEPLGAKPALARGDALAERLAATSRPTTQATYPAGLSAREVEVLRLVAQGLSDAQVAERLYLSPRTVSTHLRAIYNKLGVDNRTAAAHFAAAQGLV